MKRTYYILFFLAYSLCSNYAWSQTNIPPSLDAIGDQVYCPLSQINIVTGFDIIDPDDIDIETFSIQISSGYVLGQDRLDLLGVHPNIIATWSSAEGKLTFNGIANAPILYTDIIAAVKDVVFESSAVNIFGDKFFSFNIGDANFLPSTGHYYEYISDLGITWTNAKVAAASRTYFGLQGYLATIGSVEEAQLSGEQAAGTGWIGGSDEVTEGVWQWMTGPEIGIVFWNGGINGSTPNYANWNTGEPNSSGNEDYAHVTAPGIGIDGSWNDLSNTGAASGPYQPKGYIVEYGGMPGDPIIDISASTKISVPAIVGTTSGSRCDSGTVTIEALPSMGIAIWFDAPSGGTQIGTGNVFNTPIINSTTTFYALASVNGCLEGFRTAVIATVNALPVIISTTDALICDEGSGVLTATASAGIINWYSSLTGGAILGSGNSFTTPIVTTTTTFYIDAIDNACITPTRTPVILTVQNTPNPIGNTIQTFCDIENATIADLVVTGSNILWYTTNFGGNALDSTVSLNSITYYASQTINACESLTRLAVDVLIHETVNIPSLSTLQECDTNLDGDNTNGFTQFDLTINETLMLNGSSATDFTISYFLDATFTNQIANPSVFVNTIQNGQFIYVRISNILDNSCNTETSFSIQVNALPVIQSNIIFKNCDEDGVPDGFTDYNLTEINNVITNGNSVGLTITYYLNLNDAETAFNPVNSVPFNNSIANVVFARVENASGCYSVSTINLQVSTTSFPVGFIQELEFCDDDDAIDGLHVFDLTQASQLFLNEFPTGQNLSVQYYRNLIDAQLEQNEIISQIDYINETPFSQILYVRVESDDNGECFGIGPHLKLTVHPHPEFDVDQSSIFCLDGQPIILETFNPQGIYTYQWTDQNGVIVSDQPSATITSGGTYTVIATSNQGCESYPKQFNVVESAIADISDEDITVIDFSNNNSISINNTNNNLGIGDYEFALDDISGPYQDEPIFDMVAAGVHILYIKDKNGCGIAEIEVFVLGFPKFFTPNNDGYHDTWNIKGWSNAFSQSSSILIYDRFGKLVKQLSPSSEGWSGTFNGSKLRSSDYWFVAKLVSLDGAFKVLRGHFSLIR